MFMIVKDSSVSIPKYEKILLSKLDELNFTYEIVTLEDLNYKCSERSVVGVIFTESIDYSNEINLAPISSIDTPIIGFGNGSNVVLKAYGGNFTKKGVPLESTLNLTFRNQCVLFDFLPESIQLSGLAVNEFIDIPTSFELVVEDEFGSIYGVQHSSKEIFLIGFSNTLNDDIDARIIDNFLRYAGTFGGAL